MRASLLSGLVVVLVALPLRAQEPLPGTEPWADRGDTKAEAAAMVEGLHRFLDRERTESVGRRAERWKRDTSSPEAYVKSVEPNRERLARMIGAVEPRVSPVAMELVATTDAPALLGETADFRVQAVRWPVYADVHGEGLLVEPKGEVRANVVYLPDCDTTPEQAVGLVDGVEKAAQVPRLLAEEGCRVVVPVLLDRTSEFSGNPLVRMTNLTHREWIWRQGFETGRHPIGYEVEKVRAAIDWFTRDGQPDQPIGLAGYGEGELIALHAAALDPRVDVAWVAGTLSAGGMWSEPIERDVFGLLTEFGDAEVASLILPRGLLIEHCESPIWAGPPPALGGRSDAASGRLGQTPVRAVQYKFRRLEALRGGIGAPVLWTRGARRNELDQPRQIFLEQLHLRSERIAQPRDRINPPEWEARGPLPDPRARMKRQVRELVDHTQGLLRTSELRRYELWKQADTKSPEAWAQSVEPLREKLWTEVIGKFPPASEALKARTVLVLDEPGFKGYAVELPVWPDVVASGILLLPKDLKEGERRPVVVCQHGLEGTPQEVVDRRIESPYHHYGARLADLGYIVYAPQNPYIGVDRFRQLQRKLHPLGKSLFAVIVRQHERTLEWLETLPGVDPKRIAFYGLSYGGKTAMRVPALLTKYCLSICSADFNEWVVKCTNLDRPMSYMYTIEYDMYEWDLAGGFNYAEMAGLIAPRPFQVERGHFDGVAPDEWIGYEYAKVKRTYDLLGLADRCDITYFVGPHEIKGEGTFDFLARHLDWPRGRERP